MFNFGLSSFARVFGVEVFGDHYEKWWWKLTIWPIYSVGRAIRNSIWWMRYRIDPNHRYHVIRTHLKPNYYDIDDIMLHGMFSLLRRYVEEEHEGVDELERWAKELLSTEDELVKDVNSRQGEKEMEAVTLYRWWMTERPSMLKRQDELMEILYGGKKSRISWDEVVLEGEKVYEMNIRDFDSEESVLYSEMRTLDERIAREEQEMLHRLIDIRTRLWT